MRTFVRSEVALHYRSWMTTIVLVVVGASMFFMAPPPFVQPAFGQGSSCSSESPCATGYSCCCGQCLANGCGCSACCGVCEPCCGGGSGCGVGGC
jgi:hypothetical protein